MRTREPDAMYEFQFSDSPDTYTLTIGGKGQTLWPFTTALNQVLLPLTAVDELGELAGSLNQLSRRLSSALGELNHANALLREDVEREKEREGRQLAFFQQYPMS